MSTRKSVIFWFTVAVFSHYQMTPLHVAAERGRYREVEYLIDVGAEISTKDNNWVRTYI